VRLSFSQTDWSSFYAPGAEILAYLESVGACVLVCRAAQRTTSLAVEKYKLKPFIRLEHQLINAVYSEASGKWDLTIQRQSNGKLEQFEDTADVLFTGMGGLSRWKWPDIEGLHDFGGKLVHSANWDIVDDEEPWSTRRVGVIGVVRSLL
jgi:cation diffusion facilitator CzcD-associated flavoprotein CzcO